MHLICIFLYRPPPAQAHAHPAQAQAQAHECPPPPKPPLPLYEPVDVFGGGLVIDVILDWNSLILPTTLDENDWTPVAMEAAKSAPGTRGVPPADGTGTPPGLEAK